MKICEKYDSPAECSRSYSLFCKKDCEYRVKEVVPAEEDSDE